MSTASGTKSMARTKRPKSVFHSILWKETRQLLGFAIAMLCLATVAQLAMTLWVNATGVNVDQERMFVLMIIGGFAALFAAACGATLFATEKETGTSRNLQMLPISSAQLAKMKIAGVIPWCIAFFLVSVVIAAISVAIWQAPSSASEATGANGWFTIYCAIFGIAVIEFFAWSLLFSVICSSTVAAALLGIFFASLQIQVAIGLTGEQHIDFYSHEMYFKTWPIRLGISLVVLFLASVLAGKWLHKTPVSRDSTKLVSDEGTRNLASWLSFGSGKNGRGSRVKQFGRLTWQTLNESFVISTIAISVPILLAVAAAMSGVERIGMLALPILMTGGGLFGLAAFSADQRRTNSSALAMGGVSPGLIWLSRISVGIVTICSLWLVVFLIIAIVLSFFPEMDYVSQFWPAFSATDDGPLRRDLNASIMVHTIGQMFAYGAVAMVMCFSAGHLVSLVMKSRILGLIVVPPICAALTVWQVLMMLGGVPFWLSVLPIIIAFLIAGWWSMRSLLGSNRIVMRSVVPVCLTLAGIAAVVGGTVLHRINEIPVVDLDFKRVDNSDDVIIQEIKNRFDEVLAKVTRPDDLPTSNLQIYSNLLKANGKSYNLVFEEYSAELWNNLKENREHDDATLMKEILSLNDKYLDDNRENTNELCEAIEYAWRNRDQLAQMPPSYYEGRPSDCPLPRFASVNELLRTNFDRCIAEEDPVAAWQSLKAYSQFYQLRAIAAPERAHWYAVLMDSYSTWVLCGNQTPELLNEALNFVIDQFYAIDSERVLEFQYLESVRQIEIRSKIHDGTALYELSTLPFEKARARRLLDFQCASELESLQHEPDLGRRTRFMDWARDYLWPTQPQPVPRKREEKSRSVVESEERKMRFWARTTYPPRVSYDHHHFTKLFHLDENFPDQREFIDHYSDERLDLLLLQILCTKHFLEKGELPKDISKFYWATKRYDFLTNLRDRSGRFSRDQTIYRYHLFREGSPSGVYLTNDHIPANEPFISNRAIATIASVESQKGPFYSMLQEPGIEEIARLRSGGYRKATAQPLQIYVLLPKKKESPRPKKVD